MQKAFRKSVASLVLATTLTLAPAAPAHAITVFDPSNYAENILQASRALEQIHNQIQQIDQAARMLTQNPLQLSPEIANDITQARQLFAQAQGIAFDLQKVNSEFLQLYPQQWSHMNLGDLAAQSNQWLAQDRQSIQNAMQAEAQAAQAIGQSQARSIARCNPHSEPKVRPAPFRPATNCWASPPLNWRKSTRS